MSPNCKIIFEPHNIDNASPATVSRNGMVYMSSSGLDWKPIIQGWIIRERQPAEGDVLIGLFEESFVFMYRYFCTALVSKMEVLECMLVAQVINSSSKRLALLDNILTTSYRNVSFFVAAGEIIFLSEVKSYLKMNKIVL
jgi:hypothetical protein